MAQMAERREESAKGTSTGDDPARKPILSLLTLRPATAAMPSGSSPPAAFVGQSLRHFASAMSTWPRIGCRWSSARRK